MVTMVTSTRPVTKKGAGPGPGLPGPNGNGSKHRNGFHRPDERGNRYRIGMWVALASIAMMFTSLSSAYIVRSATANDWVPVRGSPRAVRKHGVDFDQQRHARDCETKTQKLVPGSLPAIFAGDCAPGRGVFSLAGDGVATVGGAGDLSREQSA